MSTISASTTSTTAYKVTADTTGNLVLQTGSSPTTGVYIDTQQNTGFGGATPSAWYVGSSWKALQLPSGGSLTGYLSGGVTPVNVFGGNVYWDTSAVTRAINAGYASYHNQADGAHGFFSSSASVSAGSTVTMINTVNFSQNGNVQMAVAGASLVTTPTSLPGSTSIGYSIITTVEEQTFAENATPYTYSTVSIPPGTWQITFVAQLIDASGTFNATAMACAITTDSSYSFPASTNASFRPDHNVMYTAGSSIPSSSYRGRVMHTRNVTNTTGSNVTYYLRISTNGTNTGTYGINGTVSAIKVY